MHRVVILLLSTLLAGTASAVPVLDQQPEPHGTVLSRFILQGITQSFEQHGDTLSGAGLYVRLRPGDETRLTASLISGNDPVPLAAASATVTGTGWVDVFWAPVATAGLQDLSLRFGSSNPFAAATGSFNRRGPVRLISRAGAPTRRYWDFDYRFRTFHERAEDPTPIPAPGPLALMTLCALGLGIRRRP